MERYWTLLQPKLSLEEWNYASHAALTRTRFPSVPLPSVLIEYGLEYRAKVEAEVDAAIADAERYARRMQPRLPARDTSQDALSQREAQAILDRFWPGGMLPRMPAANRHEVATDTGVPLYDSGRTAAEEQARKDLLRFQVQRSRQHEGGAEA